MDRAAVPVPGAQYDVALRDKAECIERAGQMIVANRFCRSECTNWRTHRALVTWGPDRKSFTVEHGSDQIARWAGYEVLDDEETWDEENGHAPIFMGTRQTERGTFVAQFEVAE